MHKYITLFFSVTFLFAACKGNKAPAGIINHDRMISLLTEFHVVDGGLYTIPQNPDSLYKYGTGRYLALFKKFHTDSLQFKKSVNYYATQPDELQTMYDQVLKNLAQTTDSLNKVQLNKNNALPKK